jgi:penicillin-binding protein 2
MYNSGRLRIIQLIFFGSIFILLARLFTLQVLNNNYTNIALDESLIRKIIYPERGVILDCKGRPIVTNNLVYDLMITPSQIKKMDIVDFSNALGIDTATFFKNLKTALNKKSVMPNSSQPLALYEMIGNTMYTRIQENLYKFDNFGVYLQERPIRHYPFNAGAHVLGYVAQVDTAYIRRSGGFYNQGDFAGKSGLEGYYEKILMGQRGVTVLQRDKNNKIVGSYENGKYDTVAIPGRSLKSSLDIKVQMLAEKLLHNKVGAIVAIAPKDGSIIALASGPTYDPNLLSGSSFKAAMRSMGADPAHPLFNNAIAMKSPPGSVFKPLGALIALDLGLITPSYGVGCGGGYFGCGRRVGCHGGGHAGNLRNAMAASCNSYFINIFRKVQDDSVMGGKVKGYLKWKQYVNQFGLGRKLGVDLAGESGGYIPDTSRFNRDHGYEKWNSCSMSTMGIGQDRMEATPIQMANFMCIVANKGHYYTPHFITGIQDFNKKTDTILNKYFIKNEPVHLADTAFEAVIRGMEDVLKSGTASKLKVKNLPIAGKTGTVENAVVINGKVLKQADHSVFTCFAPVDSPKIAVCVYVRNAKFGASVAGPMAQLIVKQYLNDSLDKKDSIAAEGWYKKTIFPPYLKELKMEQDSVMAFAEFNRTGDSSYILRYIPAPPPVLNIDSILIEKNKADVKIQQANKQAAAKQKEEEEKRKKEALKNGKEAMLNPNDEKNKIAKPKDKNKPQPK